MSGPELEPTVQDAARGAAGAAIQDAPYVGRLSLVSFGERALKHMHVLLGPGGYWTATHDTGFTRQPDLATFFYDKGDAMAMRRAFPLDVQAKLKARSLGDLVDFWEQGEVAAGRGRIEQAVRERRLVDEAVESWRAGSRVAKTEIRRLQALLLGAILVAVVLLLALLVPI